MGRALRWATAAIRRGGAVASSYAAFRAEFVAVFDHPTVGEDSISRLHSLQQGHRSVADYTLEFRTLAAGGDWSESGLVSAYRRGLSDVIKEGIYRDHPRKLDELISISLQMDRHLRERRAERVERAQSSGSSLRPAEFQRFNPPVPRPTSLLPAVTSGPEPMEVGRSRLTRVERERRMGERLCMYCGADDHFVRDCSARPKDSARQRGGSW